jgi:hypothetical protein
MNTQARAKGARGIWRGAALALVAAMALLLSLAPRATAAQEAEFGHATVTLVAPGAPEGAWVGIQWRDARGGWHDVQGWQEEIEVAEANGLAYKQWAVYPQDYGRGPFRWVIYTAQGGLVWATTNSFYLPNGDVANLALTVVPAAAGGIPVTGSTERQAAAGFEFSTIRVIAPDAPAGAWVGVQWQDGVGGWHDVAGWLTELAAADEDEAPSQEWAVYAEDYGQGPFRWVIYSDQGGPVWATSPRFFLPNGAGAELSMTLAPQVTLLPPLDPVMGGEPAAAQTLEGDVVERHMICGGGACEHSIISLEVEDAPAGSRVGVQWQDALGVWHPVREWQGTLDFLGDGGTGSKQWTIAPEVFARGPFRWVLYNAMGDTVLGVSPSFMLPGRNGADVHVEIAG